uniref:Gluconokinase n=1 Tax=Ditylenchus dipsaci TaxID=166011 RepID=A0A915D1E9_9BILA
MIPPFIVIGGTCGSGKSTIARKVAEGLGYEVCDGDDYHSEESKDKMASGCPLNDEDRFPWLQRLVEVKNFYQQNNSNVVLACSALKRMYRDTLIDNKTPEECVIVILKVKREELEQRIKNRPAHFARINLLDSQLSILELPKNEEEAKQEPNLLVVDANGSEEEVVKSIVQKLKAM